MQRHEAIKNFLADLKIDKRALTGVEPYPCPACSSSYKGLYSSLCDGVIYFRCVKCGFVGGPERLVEAVPSRKKPKNPGQVLDRLYEGIKDVSTRFHYNEERQQDFHAYLHKCRQKFSKMNTDVINRMTSHGVNQHALTEWLNCCGMVDSNAPTGLNFLRDEKLALSDYVTLPFFRGPILTHLSVYNPATGDLQHHRATQACEGIFLERELSWPVVSDVLVCSTPIHALTVYSKFREITPKPQNVIAVSDPEALRIIPSLNRVVLVGPGFSTSILLRYCRVGRAGKFSVFVAPVEGKLAAANHRILRQAQVSQITAQEYICDQVKAAWNKGNRNAVVSFLSDNPFTDTDRDELCNRIEDDELLSVVRSVSCLTTEISIDDIRIRRDANGFRMIEPRDERLTNFSVYADYCTDGRDGKLQIVGHIRTDKPSDGLIPISLPYSDFEANGQAFGKNMWKICVKAGSSCSFLSKRLPAGLDWFSVLREMDEVPYHPGVHKLGADSKRIQFPECYIDVADKSVRKSAAAATVSEQLHSSFNAISCSDTYDYAIVKKLMASDEIAIQAFVAGLGHVLHSLIVPALRQTSYRQHLLFHTILGDESMWSHVVKQLSSVFSTSGTVFSLSPHRWKSHTTRCPDAGNMPLFGDFCDSTKHVPEIFRESTRPIIATAPTNLLTAGIPEASVSSVEADVDCFHAGAQAVTLPQEAIYELRAALPYLLRDILAKASVTDAELESEVPALAGAVWMSRVTGQAVHQSMSKLVASYQVLEGVNSADVFIRTIKTLIRSHTCSISLALNDTINCDSGKSIGYVTDGVVTLWQRRSVTQANKLCGNRFSENNLSEMLKESYGLESACQRKIKCWRISKDRWEELMQDRPILRLMEEQPTRTAIL